MTSHHPRCFRLPSRIRSAGGVGVADGGILHPAQILDVIGMAIRIDGIMGNKNAVAINRRNVSSFQSELGWRLGTPDMSAANLFSATVGYTHACSSSPAFAAGL